MKKLKNALAGHGERKYRPTELKTVFCSLNEKRVVMMLGGAIVDGGIEIVEG